MTTAEGMTFAVLRELTAQLAAFEALLLTASAAHKVVKWSYVRGVVRRFARVPSPLASPALALVTVTEGIAALLLLMPGGRPMGGMLAALVWSVYLGLIVRAIRSDRRDVDCGCSFGTAGLGTAGSFATQRPLGWFQVSRNVTLLGVALSIAAVSVQSGEAPVEGSQFVAACALLALYGALDQVMSLRPLRGGEIL